MHAIYMDIWLLGGGMTRKVIWTKSRMTCHGDFFPIFSVFGRKNHTYEYLEGICRQFGRTKYLVILLFEQIDELRQAPIIYILF